MGDGVYQELTPTHRPHNLRLSGGWNLPELTGQGKVLQHLLGGWQINAVTTIRKVVAAMPGTTAQVLA